MFLQIILFTLASPIKGFIWKCPDYLILPGMEEEGTQLR